MSSKLKIGFLWSFLESFAVQISAFVFGIILARLLSPEEFGVIGMITVFISLSGVFINSGFTDALIRKVKIKDIELQTVFWFNLTVSLFLFGVLIVSADFISDYFETPMLKILIRVLGVGLVINALGLVQQVLVTKQMNFKLLAKISIVATLISGGTAIVLAYLNYGVWSLVYKSLIAQLITTALLWLASNWRPRRHFDISVFKDLFSFGGRLLVLGLIDTVYKNIYYLIIGKVYSPAALGLYTRAESLKNLPSQTFTSVIQRVSYPALAEFQGDKIMLRAEYKKLVTNTMFVSLLGMFLLATISKPFVVILMGEKWELAGDYLRILCFSGLFFPLVALNSNMLKIMNRADLLLKVGIWRKLIGIPVILIAVFWGIKPMLYAMIVHRIIAYLMISNYSKTFINYGTTDQIKDFGPFLLGNMALFFIFYSISLTYELGYVTTLIIYPIIFILSWIVMLEITRESNYIEAKANIKSKLFMLRKTSKAD